MDEVKKAKSKTTFPLLRKPGAGRPQRSLRKLRDPSVTRYTCRLKQAAPWLQDSDLPLVRRWAELQTIISHVYAELKEHGFLDTERTPRPLIETYRRLVLAQTTIAAQLGLSPLARRQLALSSERDDIASLLAKSVDSTDATDAEVAPESTQ